MIIKFLKLIKKFSMTIIKILWIIVLIIAIFVVLLFIKSSLTPAAPSDYTQKVTTWWEIESKYLKMWNYEVSYKEDKYDWVIEKFEIYYPSELETKEDKYPLVLMINWSWIPAKKYKSVFKHLSSWWFIVIGNEDPNTWSWDTADIMLKYILWENNNKESIFYNKIDTNNIWIEWHSQWWAWTLSALSIQANKDLYKTAVLLSPAHEELAHNMGWNYDLEEISIPTLIFAWTTWDFETKIVIPFEKMNEMYDKLKCPKVMARKTWLEHWDMLYSADGYATAWLMCYLKWDKEACKGFQWNNPEILNNKLYQDQRIDFNSINFN